FFSTVYGTNLKLHSFPTRRSSDLRRKLAGSHRSERSSQCARSKVRRSLQSIGTYLAELNFYEIAAPTKRPSYRPSDPRLFQPARSEEHTSELRHLGISYAVFCLKK